MATNQLPRVAWDSVVVIDFLDQKAGRYSFILPIAKDAENGKLMIVVSTMAIAETLHLGHLKPDEEQIIFDFFERPYVHREAAGLFVCEQARDIRRAHPVDGADSIHLATAALLDVPFFLTNDGESKRKKKPLLPLDKKIIMANKQPLRIMTPEDYDKIQRLAAAPLLAASTPASLAVTPSPPP